MHEPADRMVDVPFAVVGMVNAICLFRDVDHNVIVGILGVGLWGKRDPERDMESCAFVPCGDRQLLWRVCTLCCKVFRIISSL